VLVFSSGKLVVTGGKTVNDCEEGVQVIRKGLENMGLLSSSGSE
jgi:transcription initiation factor TFIID TATA-box-binding protein